MENQTDFLKKRAKKFYDYGIKAFKKNDFEISAFHLEQASQLYLKYTLLLILGDYPKTHRLRRLMEDIIRVTKNKKLAQLFEKYQNVIADLEEAYLTARYLPASFYKKQVENMIEFVKLLKDSLKELWT